MTIRYEQLYNKVLIVLQSKIEEFHFLHYKGVTAEDLWNYCIDRKWRKKQIEHMHLFEIVQSIFQLTPSELLNYHQFSPNQLFDLNQEVAKLLQ